MPLFAAEIEGPIDDIRPDPMDAQAVVLIVMGMTVHITKAALDGNRVRTPAGNKSVTREQLLRAGTLPGRLKAEGFRSGTAIVLGNFDPQTNRILVDLDPTAPDDQGAFAFEAHPLVEVGPPENVLLGPVSRNAAGLLMVNNVVVQQIGTDLSQDDRLPGDPIRNEFGFDIDASRIPALTTASVDGYVETNVPDGERPNFIGFAFVVDSLVPPLLVQDRPQVSILRARATNEDFQYRIDLRGGITTPVGQPIGARPTLTLFGLKRGEALPPPGAPRPVIDDRITSVRNLAPGRSVGWRLDGTFPGSAPERVQVIINGIVGPDGKEIMSGAEYVDIR
jgi:hypothetical protein